MSKHIFLKTSSNTIDYCIELNEETPEKSKVFVGDQEFRLCAIRKETSVLEEEIDEAIACFEEYLSMPHRDSWIRDTVVHKNLVFSAELALVVLSKYKELLSNEEK
jgi:hypothetical protein